jgi:hypothetical protein
MIDRSNRLRALWETGRTYVLQVEPWIIRLRGRVRQIDLPNKLRVIRDIPFARARPYLVWVIGFAAAGLLTIDAIVNFDTFVLAAKYYPTLTIGIPAGLLLIVAATAIMFPYLKAAEATVIPEVVNFLKNLKTYEQIVNARAGAQDFLPQALELWMQLVGLEKLSDFQVCLAYRAVNLAETSAPRGP